MTFGDVLKKSIFATFWPVRHHLWSPADCTVQGGDQISRVTDVTDVTLLCHIFSYRCLDCESGAENVGITVSLHAEFSFKRFSAYRDDCGTQMDGFSKF